jgi:hypothetical protein
MVNKVSRFLETASLGLGLGAREVRKRGLWIDSLKFNTLKCWE